MKHAAGTHHPSAVLFFRKHQDFVEVINFLAHVPLLHFLLLDDSTPVTRARARGGGGTGVELRTRITRNKYVLHARQWVYSHPSGGCYAANYKNDAKKNINTGTAEVARVFCTTAVYRKLKAGGTTSPAKKAEETGTA